MKIIDYDSENYAILVKKRQLEGAGLGREDDVYIITLQRGVLAVIRKSSFKDLLKEKVRMALELPELPQVELTGDDLSLLRKITSVKFEERIPENVLKMLSGKEMQQLKSLVDRGILSVYKGGKYQAKGVYAIPRDVYRYVRRVLDEGIGASPPAKAQLQAEEQPVVPKEQKISPQKSEEQSPQRIVPQQEYKLVADAVRVLDKDGFVVISNDDLARAISGTLQEKIKKGAVMGMKGFDGKYYIMHTKKYLEADSLLRTYLSENKRATLTELAKNLEIDEVLCRGVLNYLLESGDVIEKSRGKYELVG